MKTLFSALFLILLTHLVWAQEFYVHSGAVHRNESHSNSMGYGVSYFQKTSDHTLVSLSYINEGHLEGHHRDGLAPQIWWRQMVGRHFSLSAGIGPFVYFDTIGAHEASSDNHGVGGILSAAVTWHSFSPFLVQLRTNWIPAVHSINTTSATIALGYQLDVSKAPASSLLFKGEQPKNEVTLFVGRTVLNQFHTAQATAGAIEYRRNLAQHLDWTFTVLYEGDVVPIRRFGPVTQLWLVENFYGDRLSLGVGAGPYLTFDESDKNTEIILTGPVITLTGACRLIYQWGFRVSWNRVTTGFDRDTDVFMGGISYRF